jgi:hypothetical protein
MFSTMSLSDTSDMTPTTPWSIRAWPPVLWQAGRESQLRFRHLSTRVTLPGDRSSRSAGQTIWGGHSDDGEAGVAWDWVQISGDVVAMADPMAVVTNLRLIGEEGEVLTALESARFLNEIVHALPWQNEVQRALQVGHA